METAHEHDKLILGIGESRCRYSDAGMPNTARKQNQGGNHGHLTQGMLALQ